MVLEISLSSFNEMLKIIEEIVEIKNKPYKKNELIFEFEAIYRRSKRLLDKINKGKKHE